MSSVGEIFVKIDTSQLDEFIDKLQGGGEVGTVTRGGRVYDTGMVTEISTPKTPLMKGAGYGGFSITGKPLRSPIITDSNGYESFGGSNSVSMPSINRGVRSIVGTSIPGAYGAIGEYNKIRWLMSGTATGVSTALLLFASEIIRVQKEVAENAKKQERMIMELGKLTGPAYEAWKKIQEPQYRRTAP